MTIFATRNLKQDAVLWMASGNTDDEGEPLVAAAVPIKVRWLDQQTEEQNAQGDTIITDTTVIVDRVIALDSIMWLGAKDDLPDTFTDNSLRQVVIAKDTPSWNNRSNRRVLGLVRYRNELPTLA